MEPNVSNCQLHLDLNIYIKNCSIDNLLNSKHVDESQKSRVVAAGSERVESPFQTGLLLSGINLPCLWYLNM